MLISQALLTAALAAVPTTAHWCRTEHPSEDTLAVIKGFREAERIDKLGLSRRQSTTIHIPLYMHAVVNTTNAATVLDEATLLKQFDVLADRFAPHDIRFALKGIDRVIDDGYARGWSNPIWPGHMITTRKGDYATLNIWYVTNMDPAMGGACSFPSSNAPPGSISQLMDGCTLQSYSVPGGTFNGTTYLGEISVHEVGHWLGLLHTFQGESCTGEGDYIDDTPAEASYEFMACPVGKDTCPEQEGLDPIDNFMDYSGDGCWKRFTPGQKARMHNTWFTIRSPTGNFTTTRTSKRRLPNIE